MNDSIKIPWQKVRQNFIHRMTARVGSIQGVVHRHVISPQITRSQVETSPLSVCQVITSILGAEPNRTDLIHIVNMLNWGPLLREEKRVKQALCDMLERKKAVLIPFLETQEGRRTLQSAYVAILRTNHERLGAPSQLPVEG
jgi:hypothetical protein